MASSPLRAAVLALLLAGIVSGCRCGETGTQRAFGEIGVVYPVDGQITRTDRDARYDFGSVFMGQKVAQKILIKNLGTGELTLSALEKVDGDAVKIGPEGDAAAVWEVEFEGPITLGASELAELTVTFRPPQQDLIEFGHQVRLKLSAQNARAGEETAEITLSGRAVSGVCELPSSLDFGQVAIEDTEVLSFAIRNPTQLQAQANVGELYSTSGDHKAFAFTAESARGAVTLEPNTEGRVELSFRPTEARDYVAFVKAQASAQCPEQSITLVGKGVTQLLTWTPVEVDCGYVPPGNQVTSQLTIVNAGKAQTELTALRTLNASEFSVDVTSLSVPAATLNATGGWDPGTAKVTVTCKPAVVGPRTSQLAFSTGLSRQPEGFVDLRVFGGGPDIKVTPSPALNFGKVAYFSSGSSFQRRKLTVMNVGSAPPTPDSKANLKITSVTVTPLNADTAADEFSIIAPASYDPTLGLQAVAGKNLAEWLVQLTPKSVGLKKAEVKIASNDPDQPVVTIVASADAVVLPPCDYSVTPTVLGFGLISPPDYRDLGFTIKNNGIAASDLCLLSGLDTAPGSHPFFSLPAGAIESRELLPQETIQVLVRVWAQGTTPNGVAPLGGSVEFYLSSDTRPQGTVTLNAQLAPSCLTIAPDDLDFGTVAVGCSSATRTFSIYNTCPSAVTLNAFAMQSPAGQGAGGPDCPGTSACPEFHLVQTPTLPTGGLTLQPGANPVTFQAKYRPIDLGADTGAVAISANQNGAPVSYVVALKGKGDAQGLHTDVFTQDARPKADILLVIDNSCSMADEQTSLAANFASFIQYANAAQVDYHIAVTSTDMVNAGEQGRFVAGAGHPEKVLTPTTIDVENKFKQKVNLGITGSGNEMGAEPALKALTAPLVNSDNANFLRPGAALAVVVITDEADQSPQSTAFYLNGFWNLKGFNQRTLFTFNAIAGFSAACQSQLGSGDSGEYAHYVAQTNGVKDDICTPDWSKTLETLGKTAFGFRTTFFLTAAPDLSKGPIQVSIDGIPVPQVDSFGDPAWHYDAVANAVRFEASYVPEPGQALLITYSTICY